MNYKGIKIIIVFAILIGSSAKTIGAQPSSSGLAISLPIKSEGVEDGHIICGKEEGFVLCNLPYDTQMYGVISDNPAVALEAPGTEGDITRLVLQDGTAQVKVSGIGGSIQEGDFVTTSDVPGVGQLAERNGYVLGAALESFEPENEEDTALILIALNMHPATGLSGARSDLLQAIRQGAAAPLFEPLSALRYILAAAMILIAFSLGFIYFGRVAKTGIEAMGRNPMASRMIQMAVLFNIVITIVIVLIGLAIAYLILIL